MIVGVGVGKGVPHDAFDVLGDGGRRGHPFGTAGIARLDEHHPEQPLRNGGTALQGDRRGDTRRSTAAWLPA
jgi:hypothetical protein